MYNNAYSWPSTSAGSHLQIKSTKVCFNLKCGNLGDMEGRLYLWEKKKSEHKCTREVQTVCSRVKDTWGSSLDSDCESVIMHFLRGSFIVSILPTVFLKELSFPFAKLCRNCQAHCHPRRLVPHSALPLFLMQCI